MRFISPVLFLACAIPTISLSQSTITLDSFSIAPADDTARPSEADTIMDCLSGSDTCDSSEYGGGTAFSLDDIVNLGIVDRSEVAEESAGFDPTEPLPTIDLEVFFEYNSDRLTASAERQLGSLSEALSDPRVRESRIIFIGHTDAVGGADYNLDLSRRRAEAVARYVVQAGGFPPEKVDATGVGFTRLKNTIDPAAQENRRVQVLLVPTG